MHAFAPVLNAHLNCGTGLHTGQCALEGCGMSPWQRGRSEITNTGSKPARRTFVSDNNAANPMVVESYVYI